MSPIDTLDALRRRAQHCTACELYKKATQTVFGEGPATARIVLIGEQPGDREDLEGLPFVGPAGQLLDRALEAAGIDRGACYVTNAVKHFKWEPRGKRRLHKTPAQREVNACRQWWLAELQALQPAVIVCLGATAARAVLGAEFRVTRERGQVRETPFGARAVATLHPSAILRIGDPGERTEAFNLLVADLRIARKLHAIDTRKQTPCPPNS
jgi:uracil-DNA glycosylase family protein